jgi:membrane-bound metal-dependent hydrolase YbcI (DUF457 family)
MNYIHHVLIGVGTAGLALAAAETLGCGVGRVLLSLLAVAGIILSVYSQLFGYINRL